MEHGLTLCRIGFVLMAIGLLGAIFGTGGSNIPLTGIAIIGGTIVLEGISHIRAKE